MNSWLIFCSEITEDKYQAYIALGAVRYLKVSVYLILSIGIISTFSITTEYYFAGGEYYEFGILLLLLRIMSVIISCGAFVFMQIMIKKNQNCLLKYRDLFYWIIGIIILISLAIGVIIDETLGDFYKNNYEPVSKAHEIGFYSIIFGFFFSRWTFKVIYFFSSCLLVEFTQVNTILDKVHIIKAVMICFVYGGVVYFIEKNSRQIFTKFERLLEKENIWKRLLDDLPEDILIVNQQSKIKYKNESSLTKTNENDINEHKFKEDILENKVIELILQDSIEGLNMRFERGRSYADKMESQNFGIFETENDLLKKKEGIVSNVSPDDIKQITQTINKLKSKPQDLKEVIKIINEGYELFNNEFFILTFDGIYGEKSVEVKILSTNFDDEECLQIIISDTTHRNTITKLERYDKYKNIILSTVSHEMRNPLNSSISMIQLAIDDPSISSKAKEEILEPCSRSLGMLANLVNDILDYAQISENKLKLVYKYIDIKELIYDACLLIEIQCQRKGLKIRVYADPDLPRLFKTDPNRLTQILLNLLSNALKFTSKGYIKIMIKIKDQNKSLIAISVQDTGIGIKEEDIPKLFQEFGKLDLAHNAKMNPTGCGLGLNISQKLAKCLGQENSEDCGITVESKAGKGTTFTFIIEDKNINQNESQSMMLARSSVLADIQSNIRTTRTINRRGRYSTKKQYEENFDISINEGITEHMKNYRKQQEIFHYTKK